jgi:hypothetical protein
MLVASKSSTRKTTPDPSAPLGRPPDLPVRVIPPEPRATGIAASERRINPPAPRNLRFQHQPLLWRAIPNLTRRFRGAAGAAGEDDEDLVAETQLHELREFRETKFMPRLFADIENRFELMRATRLILPKGSGNSAGEPFDRVVEMPVA